MGSLQSKVVALQYAAPYSTPPLRSSSRSRQSCAWRLWIDRSAERRRIPRAILQDLIVAIIKDSEKKARDAETAARRQELAVRRERERKQREREANRQEGRIQTQGKRESIREPDQFAEGAAGNQARRTGKTTRRGRRHHSRPFYSICWHAKLGCINKFMECRTLARSGRRKSFARVLAVLQPEPGAAPCIRQRLFPRTAGDLQGLPERVLAPQRGLDNIGPVSRR